MRFFPTRLYLTSCLLLFVSACASDSSTGAFTAPSALAVDSSNNRVFIAQTEAELLVFAASDFSEVGGDQPLVSEDSQTAIQALLPQVISGMAVYASGTSSRLFILGAVADEADDLVLNRITVLDFDGADFAEASFSPIIMSDGDDTTDETDDTIVDMIVDQDSGNLFVVDTTGVLLYVLSAVDGSTVQAPIAIAGRPHGLASASGRLFVCNTSAVADEQTVRVVNLDDFTTTVIDFDLPCDHIAAVSDGASVFLMANIFGDEQVRLYSVNTTFDGVTAIAAADPTTYSDGALIGGAGISSVVGGLAASLSSTGEFHGYVSLQDGYIAELTLPADLSSYAVELLSTAAINIAMSGIYTDTSTDAGIMAYFVAEGGEVLSLEVGSTEVDLHN